MGNIYVTVGRLMDAKFGFIKGKLYETITINNMNKIKNWNEIKKSSQWVNVNFQAQGDNRDTKHFLYNFITESMGDNLNVTLKLIDNENKETKFKKRKKNSNCEYFA